MRKTKRYLIEGENSLWQVYKTVSFWKTFRNVIVIEIARYIPFFRLKNWMYRNLIGMKVGDFTSFAFKVTPDLMFPELISVGKNSIIGYNTTILAHEYLINEYRLGEVIIGNNVLVGANTTILPGVTIGDGAKISAATLVNKDVPAGAFVGGNPMVIISLPQPETTT
ncbi:DapH/DapD/GlmU-related protein [Bacillus sp. AFS041924]|uniref:acyltransferase n=1 Tax=Bacillus sp. AFS041924 TaxID=2033503 RepID=UPI000BFB8086|nr:acyltransferase [Bacillus sp. AFS041924]PGS52001.1 acetyltransferase [Bacillus sp. AFS041924]